MNRRQVLIGSSACATVGACGPAPQDGAEETGGAAPASAPAIQTAPKRELTMTTTWPKNFPGLGGAAERFAQEVSALSDGRLTVKLFAANELVGALEAFDAVTGGAADMYHGAEYYWQGKAKAFNFFAAVPFGLTATEFLAWLEVGGGQELWEEVSDPFGVIAFPCGNTGVQMGGWFNKEMNALEDFQALSMRIPGLGAEVISALGGAPVSLSGDQIFQALQQGAIDATEWVGPWNDLAFGLHQAAEYYYGPGFHEPGTMLSLGINKAVWTSLSAHDRAIIRTAARAATTYNLAEFAYRNAAALTTLRDEHGVTLRPFPDELWPAAATVAEEVVADVAGADAQTRKVYDAYVGARAALAPWQAASEGDYIARRNAAVGL